MAAAAKYVVVGASGEGLGAEKHVAVGRWRDGDEPADAGRLAGEAVQRAVEMVLAGDADALVTAPADKAALQAGGYDFPGHTEMLRQLTGAPAVAMLMAAERTRLGGPLRVVLATRHIALSDVPSRLSAELIEEQARMVVKGLRSGWGIAAPRLALCAINPHGGDGGLFGDEEAKVLVPARVRLAEAGISVCGPIPADTVFVRALRGEFDAVIAPYHDVGMAAFKTASFGSGVNVTLGLPFPRTSPDHGTALDIAGRGVADPGSMIEAMLLAARLCASL